MTTDRPSSHDAETAPVLARPTSSAEEISRLLAAEKTPERIGDFKILRLIGSGGMGLVYLAQKGDATFTQTVALKVIKKGMDSEEILRRFELERQLLSGLNHPNIARLVDGGTLDDGRPYFALEYVEGQPIDRYCDANRLSTRDRLNLFRKVCAAVHFAHQNLIVHRDLKPSNVLVNAQGDPKLLDFGIAKLLNPTLFQAVAVTGPTVRLMTPEYASPEQVRGDSITTASDIYSLGVMLYELLTGRRPYKFKTRLQDEIVRIVCEVPPERPSTVISRIDEEPIPGGEGKTRRVDPSTVADAREGDINSLRRRLRGDIDDIVLKALEKTPTRRYASAEQLSEDIDRHLNGEPVIARPPSLSYRAAKFVRRNRGKVSAAAAVGLALVLGVIGTSVQWARAEQARADAVLAQRNEQEQRHAAEAARAAADEQRRVAEAAAAVAQKCYEDTWDVLESYIGDVHAGVAKLPGAVEAREIIVETAAAKMQSLADNWKSDAEKRLTVSGGFERLGQLAHDIRGGSEGQTAKALAFHETCLDMRRELLDADPKNLQYQRAVASSYIRLGDTARSMGDRTKAVEHYEHARTLLEALPTEGAAGTQVRIMLATVLGQLADDNRQAGRITAAIALYEQGDKARTALRDALVASAAEPNLTDKEARQRRAAALQARRNVTVGRIDLARAHLDLADTDKALPLIDEALAERRALLAEEPAQARTQRDLAVALILASEARSTAPRGGRHADAIRESSEAVDIMSRLTAQEAQSNRPDARNIMTLGNCRAAAATALFLSADTSDDPKGTIEAALRSWQAAGQLYAERLAADPENLNLKAWLADTRCDAAACHLRLGAHREALASAEQALGILRPIASSPTAELGLRAWLALSLRRAADAHAALATDAARARPDREASRAAARAAYNESLQVAESILQNERTSIDPETTPDSIRAAIAALDANQ